MRNGLLSEEVPELNAQYLLLLSFELVKLRWRETFTISKKSFLYALE